MEELNVKSFFGLDLSYNGLSHFDVRILEDLPRIEEINLSENKIDHDEEEMLERLNKSFKEKENLARIKKFTFFWAIRVYS